MSPQASLFGQTDEQKSGEQKCSLFFGLFPNAEDAARLFTHAQELRTQHGLTGRVIGAERLHVTLHWLGDYAGALPEQILMQARQAAGMVSSPALELTFDKVRSFFGRSARPFVLGMREENTALTALHRKLGEALLQAGVGKLQKGPYTPHVTLLYDRKPVASQPIEPLHWTARELVLVRSLIGKSQYERLGSWSFNQGTEAAHVLIG